MYIISGLEFVSMQHALLQLSTNTDEIEDWYVRWGIIGWSVESVSESDAVRLHSNILVTWYLSKDYDQNCAQISTSHFCGFQKFTIETYMSVTSG